MVSTPLFRISHDWSECFGLALSMLALEGNTTRQVKNVSASLWPVWSLWSLRLYRSSGYSSCGRKVEMHLEERGETKWEQGWQTVAETGWPLFRLQWDWDSTKVRHHHCDSVCFGAGPEPRNTPGSIRRDEGEKCVTEHKITVLPGAWKSLVR